MTKSHSNNIDDLLQCREWLRPFPTSGMINRHCPRGKAYGKVLPQHHTQSATDSNNNAV